MNKTEEKLREELIERGIGLLYSLLIVLLRKHIITIDEIKEIVQTRKKGQLPPETKKIVIELMKI